MAVGGPVAVSDKLRHACSQGQRVGRCSVNLRADDAIRAGMLIRWVRSVAQRARACRGEAATGGAGEVEGDHRVRQPRGVRRVLPRRQVGERSVLEFGDGLLDERVVPVPGVGLDQGQGRVGG